MNWNERAVVTLTNGLVELTLLPGGGHLAHWGFAGEHGPTQQNALWEAPWKTADPGTPAHAAIADEFQDEEAGSYLASYTGHVLCLDGFGAASAEDAAKGVSLHGEAPTAIWSFTKEQENEADGSVELPVAGLRVDRRFVLAEGESVLRIEEHVTNLRAAERALHWVQHSTFGAPLFGSGGRATASVQQGVTLPQDYDECNLLARDASFTWPYAPGANGERVDLRELFGRRGAGFVAATQQAAGREHGFVAVCQAEIGLAVGYVFRVEDFPWVALWEENDTRHAAPWRGRVQARGMEFGTTPLPLGNEAVDARGPLFGRATSRRIGAHETLRAPWLMFVAEVPREWREIEDVRVEADAIVLVYQGECVRVGVREAASFLGKA
ncbi:MULTISPECIES: DUF4432 family protein [Acidobacteriaceae]|uniref:DUF4432 family protein n=1 Tax=Acidobacteriaceae TaxID=204434 RepID=UPI00131D8679|nr:MULTISPECIES: hypothetical protein [Acidobacteriaceae]MDW5265483.1 hypothetical protein [Edaphobacter sp.]